ncbi:MAG: amidohydrolase family protein [Pseudomonadota bacterium]
MRVSNLILVLLLTTFAKLATADVLLQGGEVISGSKADPWRADVLVRGGKITQIGENLSAPEGVETVDISGKKVTTGIFNSHTQLGLREVGAVRDTVDDTSKNERVTAALRVADAINPSSVLIPHNRMLGVTHAMVQPDSDAGLFAGSAAIISLAANSETVKVDNAGMVLKLGSQGKDISGGSRAVTMALLREAFEDARDYRANKDSFNRGARRDYQLSRHDLDALIPVLQRRVPLIVHVERAIDIERTIDLAKNYNLRLIIVGAEEGWRVADKLAENKIPVIMDPIANLPTSYDTLGSRLDNAKLLNDAGVTLLFTGMGWHNTHNAYLVRQSAGNAVANGLPYQVAIQAITTNPAKVFGLSGLGDVKIGNAANLVVWSGDPLEPATIVEKVLIDGEDQPLVSRATRLRDRYFSRLRNPE